MSIPKQRGRLAAESYISSEGWPLLCPFGSEPVRVPYEQGTVEHQAWMEGWWETMEKIAPHILIAPGSNAAALAYLEDGLHEEIVCPEGD